MDTIGKVLIITALTAIFGCGYPAFGQSNILIQVNDGSTSQTIIKIRQSSDVETIKAVYNSASDRNNLELNRAYMTRIVELGSPEIAYPQARIVEQLDANDGLSMGVIAFVEAGEGNMSSALANIILAAGVSPNDRFILRTAGQLCAWYDWNAGRITIDDFIVQSLADMRKKLNAKMDFAEALAEATAAYKELAGAEKDMEQTDQISVLSDDVVITDGDDDSAIEYMISPDEDENVFTSDIEIYGESDLSPAYPPACRPADTRLNLTLIIFIGPVRCGGLSWGRFCGRDIFVDHDRRIFCGYRHNAFPDNVRIHRMNKSPVVGIENVSRIVKDRFGRLTLDSAHRALAVNNSGRVVSEKIMKPVVARTVNHNSAGARTIANASQAPLNNGLKTHTAAPVTVANNASTPARVKPATDATFKRADMPVRENQNRSATASQVRQTPQKPASFSAPHTTAHIAPVAPKPMEFKPVKPDNNAATVRSSAPARMQTDHISAHPTTPSATTSNKPAASLTNHSSVRSSGAQNSNHGGSGRTQSQNPAATYAKGHSTR